MLSNSQKILFNILLLTLLQFLDVQTTPTPIFPEPVGPYYGYPYSTNTANKLPIPVSAYGKCQAGTNYTITKGSDLVALSSELQCIFSTGLTPSKVPEGAQPGRFLTALNSRHPIFTLQWWLVWRGNLNIKAKCNSSSESPSDIYIGFTAVYNYAAILPTLVYIGSLPGNTPPGEWEDGRPSYVMDFTADLAKICPDYPDFVERNKASLPVTVKNVANFYPNTQIVEVWRLVGRQEDGGVILLGKTYFRDIFGSDLQLATIGFGYLISYDKNVNPEFGIGESLPPLEHSFDYTFPGLTDVVLRYLPINNLLTRPLATLNTLFKGFRKLLTNIRNRISEYIQTLGTRTASRRKLRQYFRNVTKIKIVGHKNHSTTTTSTTTETSLTDIPTTTQDSDLDPPLDFRLDLDPRR